MSDNLTLKVIDEIMLIKQVNKLSNKFLFFAFPLIQNYDFVYFLKKG